MSQLQKTGELFLSSFNRLESQFSHIANQGKFTTWHNLVDIVSQSNALVRYHAQFLKRIGDLRNAIVHDRDYPLLIIADPRPGIVERMETLLAQLERPEMLLDNATRNPRVFVEADNLGRVLSWMGINNFSQVPVMRNNKKLVLLTRESVSMWVEKSMEDDIISLAETTVSQVLVCTDLEDYFCLVPRTYTVLDAIQCFAEHPTRLQALLITEQGKQSEALLGITSAWDLGNLLQICNLGLGVEVP